jgi:2-polyprenyl-3-methyl-5-hydroxy-6-metoxy-1,4-benzoquinol methylase
MSEIEFDKYARKGAYHWRDYYGGLLRMNAGTKARYDTVVDCLRRAGVTKSMRLVDIGCGDGALCGVIAKELGCEVTGVDPSADAIRFAGEEFARRGLAGEFVRAEGYRYPFPDGAFAAAVCSDVIEHVQEPRALLSEIRRLLRPGGALVLTTPIRFTEAPQDPLHVQEWFGSEFMALCRPVFGEPVARRRTHPVFWYEAYVLPGSTFSRLARLFANALARLGRNPFLGAARPWRCYTTQTLVLRRPPGSAA